MYEEQRNYLVDLLRYEGIHNESVLQAIHTIPREAFLPADLKPYAYENRPFSIGHGQTISQPYVVATMTQALLGDQNQKQAKKILEIGTGSGYQAAILSMLVNAVYSVERIKELCEQAQKNLKKLTIRNVFLSHGDGYLGWPEYAPYDGILVTAAASYVPTALLAQLTEGGRLIIPINIDGSQVLRKITKFKDRLDEEQLEHVVFVPMIEGIEGKS